MGKAGKMVSLLEVLPLFCDGQIIMFGGFMGVGTPAGLVRALLDSGARDLTLIGNDTASPVTGVGPLIAQRRVQKVIASHIGTNPETGRQMIAGALEVELVPQGTLAERVRCGGAGLGGVLTRTGVGTLVADGKPTFTLDDVQYLVELPLRADVALVRARLADPRGNLVYERAARNFNPLIAMAAELVLAEVDEVTPLGGIDPEHVITPGELVDRLVLAERA